MSDADVQLIKDLARNKDIIISKPDKGQGVVLINRCDYINKIEDILNDKTKFQEVFGNCESLIIKK